MKLELLLQIAAAAQLGIALLNFFLVRLLDWKRDVAQMPLLLREVFIIHMWFISITLLIFGIITWRFAPEMAHGAAEICRWLAAGIGSFWAIRAILQVTYYSSSHWRGNAGRTIAHVGLLLVYSAFAIIYLRAAWI